MPSQSTIWLDIPAQHNYLAIVYNGISEMLRAAGALADLEQTIYNIQLAVHEGCMNILEHAYENQPDRMGRIQVELTLHGSPCRLIIDLRDTGRAFDLAAVPPPNPDEPQVRGYGLFLMRQIMDEVHYCSADDHNHWTLVKHLAWATGHEQGA